MAISMEILEQVQAAMAQLPAVSTPMVPIERDAAMKGQTRARAKEFPQVKVYHLQYDAQGKVIDYHLDHWRKDANGLMLKLNRRNQYNKPVWALKLPADAMQPEQNISCRHPQCGRTFRTTAEEDLHMRHQHREFYQMVLQDQEANDRKRQLEALERQNEMMRQLLAQQAPGQSKRGVTHE